MSHVCKDSDVLCCGQSSSSDGNKVTRVELLNIETLLPFSYEFCRWLHCMLRGVRLKSLALSTEAPWSSKRFTMSIWPRDAATCSGVQPQASVALTSAPIEISDVAVSSRPLRAAKCNGENPS